MLKTNDKAVLKEKIIICPDCDREKALPWQTLSKRSVWFKLADALLSRRPRYSLRSSERLG